MGGGGGEGRKRGKGAPSPLHRGNKAGPALQSVFSYFFLLHFLPQVLSQEDEKMYFKSFTQFHAQSYILGIGCLYKSPSHV